MYKSILALIILLGQVSIACASHRSGLSNTPPGKIVNKQRFTTVPPATSSKNQATAQGVTTLTTAQSRSQAKPHTVCKKILPQTVDSQDARKKQQKCVEILLKENVLDDTPVKESISDEIRGTRQDSLGQGAPRMARKSHGE